MSEMVERVAEALWKAAGFGAWHSEGFANRPDYIREQYLRDAKAAIEAMPDPAENTRLREALQSIAKNTCCDRCQEAALVAQAALKG